MQGIRREVEHFNLNIADFSSICDFELTKLYENVEKVSEIVNS